MMRRIFAPILIFALLAGGVVSAETTPTAIAIIDTGISNHNDLLDMSRVAEGVNYAIPTQDTEDKTGHGTAIASLILGSEDGTIPASAENATLIPLVYYSKYQTGVTMNGGITAIIHGIYDAIDLYHCQVINISSGITYDAPALYAAIQYAEEQGVIIVAAVGNNNLNYPDLEFYPATYDTVVGVGAALDDTVAPFSQRAGVTVVTDGVSLQVAGIKNASDYNWVSGTSYSAAYVSALAADLLQLYPQMTPADFRQILAQSAQDIGAEGFDADSGFGLLDTLAALDMAKSLY